MKRNPGDLLIFIVKRLMTMVVLLFGATFIVFLISHVMVSDPAVIWAGKHASKAEIAAVTNEYHLKAPIYVQYYYYMKGIISGNWGYNTVTGAPVLSQILHYFPATLELVLGALFIMTLIGIPLGVLAASRQGKLTDHLIRAFYLSGWATPTFLGSIILVLIFGLYIRVLPDVGMFSSSLKPPPTITGMPVLDSLLAGNIPDFVNSVEHLILPAVSLAFLNFGIATRMTRASMLEVFSMDYIKAARSKGLTERIVLFRHALRNALTSTVTVLALLTGSLLSGTVVIEEIFAWPGIGTYAYNSILLSDYPAIIGVTIFFTSGVILSNLVADILYAVLDPKVEWG
ncbi:MAG: ABC transporter permease [Candidatus Thermoplasmatota archaeon]|uniref:ABC transporter permease n=1 Tax=Candidatus Sysuiplasma superficiale TaxID=2823368 RepID=A0A8J8CEV3_9ARCH|nr:ABC transporter permease [Candidatus Sysuiplasma superficiale]MCL4346944.1 ABC transporter permease [Candidatus Thermoplasmatota archaeon]